jgi:hypothetical protein
VAPPPLFASAAKTAKKSARNQAADTENDAPRNVSAARRKLIIRVLKLKYPFFVFPGARKQEP